MGKRVLIGVVTCHKYRSRSDAQRRTWVRDVEGMDVRFFVGGGDALRDDEVVLDVDDGYAVLADKVAAMFRWALENGYDYVFKCDDDVYLRPERLLAAVPYGEDYVGRLRGAALGHPAPYCSGFGYWMSRVAMEVRVGVGDGTLLPEDLLTGNVLHTAGIVGEYDGRYVVCRSTRNAISRREGPRADNDVIAACEFDGEEMDATHQEWLTLPSGEGYVVVKSGSVFDDVDVMVKTFLRDGLMKRCVKGVEQFLHGSRLIVVDDGWESRSKISYYSGLRLRGHIVVNAPFDTGYGAKNNIAAKHYERKYVLRIADDFDMSGDAVADGVRAMIDVLESDPSVGIASGRVGGYPYEGMVAFKEREDGLKDVVATRVPEDAPRLRTDKGTEYVLCDYTVNYSLIRRELMEGFVWDEKYKIGGDHLDLYMHAWKMGFKVAYVVGANVDIQRARQSYIDPCYGKYRGRARLALPWTYERHGWASFTGFDGVTDTRESAERWVNAYYNRKVASAKRVKKSTPAYERKKEMVEERRKKVLALRDRLTRKNPGQ